CEQLDKAQTADHGIPTGFLSGLIQVWALRLQGTMWAFMGVDGQKPYFSSSEAMLGYSWNSKSATGSNGMKSNDYNSKRTMNPYAAKSSSYGMDMKSRQQSASTVPKSFLQPILRRLYGFLVVLGGVEKLGKSGNRMQSSV
ncbi:hypothetical protein Tco_1269554, partial [Tanacetum coccineum]